jgi:hypothetical protein
MQEDRYDDSEISGGRIALITTNNNPVQVPPRSLDRMHASRQRQIAFNKRVLKAEEQIARINSGFADFLQDMSFDPVEPVFVCVIIIIITKMIIHLLGLAPVGCLAAPDDGP